MRLCATAAAAGVVPCLSIRLAYACPRGLRTPVLFLRGPAPRWSRGFVSNLQPRPKKGEMDLDDHPVPCPPCGELVSNGRPAPGRTDACYASECGSKRKPAPVWAVRDTLREVRARPLQSLLSLSLNVGRGASTRCSPLLLREPGRVVRARRSSPSRGTVDPRADSETAWR